MQLQIPHVDRIDWNLDAELHLVSFDPFVALEADLTLPVTFQVDGQPYTQEFHFSLKPRFDPTLDLRHFDIDVVECPFYWGLTPPPKNKELRPSVNEIQAEQTARRTFVERLLAGTGTHWQESLQSLFALPSRVFARFMTQFEAFYNEQIKPKLIWGVERLADAIKRSISGIVRHLEQQVQRAMGWVISLGREVVRKVLGTADEIKKLTVAGCEAFVEGAIALHEGVINGGVQLADTLNKAYRQLATDAVKYAAHIQTVTAALVRKTGEHAQDFTAAARSYINAGLGAIIDASGYVEDQIRAYIRAAAEGVKAAGAAIGRTAKDVNVWFDQLLEDAGVMLKRIADEPELVIVFLARLIRDGLEILIDVGTIIAKEAKEIWRRYAEAFGRAWAALSSVYKPLADKTAQELDAYIKPVLERIALLAKKFGKATKEAFVSFLQTLASAGRSLFHGVCWVLHETQQLVIDLVGEEVIAEAKDAVKFLCDWLGKVTKEVGQAIDKLYQLGKFLSTSFSEKIDHAAALLRKNIKKLEGSLSQLLRRLFNFLVVDIGGRIQSSAAYKALVSILGAISDLARTIASFVQEKTNQVDAWMKQQVKAVMEAVESTVRSIEALMSGAAAEPKVLEARFRALKVGKPRSSSRSGAVVSVLTEAVASPLMGSDVLLPVLQRLLGADIETGALELYSYPDWRFTSPHPVDGILEKATVAPERMFFPVPYKTTRDMTFRLCISPRMYTIDPRYTWGYGSSFQIQMADIDGDGKVDAWEVSQNAKASKDIDNDGVFTARDVQLMLEQSKNVLHGVPYKVTSAPMGLLVNYEDGQWLWFSIASISDEDIGSHVQEGSLKQRSAGADDDPKAAQGSLVRVGAGGSVIPHGEKLDRTGIGLFFQGRLDFFKYPLRFHVEKRYFYDEFATGFGNPGQSTFLVVRGGDGGNDFQLRGELYEGLDIMPGMGLPFVPSVDPVGDITKLFRVPYGMYTPSIRLSFRLGAAAAAELGGKGGMRVGIEYKAKTPIASLLGEKPAEEGESSYFDKALDIFKEKLNFDKLPPLMRQAWGPILRLLMFDHEFESHLACVGALVAGHETGMDHRIEWAKKVENRKRTLGVLRRAEELYQRWNETIPMRAKEALLVKAAAQRPDANSPAGMARLKHETDALWGTVDIPAPAKLELFDVASRFRAFKASVVAVGPGEGLDEKYDAWARTKDGRDKFEKFATWSNVQRCEVYGERLGVGVAQIAFDLNKGDYEKAWQRVINAIESIDISPGDCADDLCEALLSMTATLDIILHCIAALKEVKNHKADFAKEYEEKQKAAEKAKEEAKKTPTPDPRKVKVLSKLGDQSQDDRWAHALLTREDPKYNTLLGITETLSLVWSLDAGVGLGAGEKVAGAGVGIFATAGFLVTPPSFTLPTQFLAPLSSKLQMVRFACKYALALLETLDIQMTDREGAVDWDAITLWITLAAHDALKQMLDPKEKAEDWIEKFLSGTTMTANAALEAVLDATGAIFSVAGRGAWRGEISMSLASLMEPLVEVLQADLTRPGEKALLRERLIPKISMGVSREISASVACGPAMLEWGYTGQAVSGDFVLPDGSPWRKSLEHKIDGVIRDAIRQREALRERSNVPPKGYMATFTLVLKALDALLRDQIDSVKDYESKTKDEKNYSAIVTNPTIANLIRGIRDPASYQKEVSGRRKRTDELVKVIRETEVVYGEYPDHPGAGLRSEPGEQGKTYDVLILVPDGAEGKFSPKKTRPLHRVTYRIPLDPAPANVLFDSYRRKDDLKAPPTSGLAVGFRKRAEAEAFVGKRSAAWVDGPQASVAAWPSPRAGGSSDAQWYQWLNTKLFAAIEAKRTEQVVLEQPLLSVDKEGVVLSFPLVERGLLEKDPFTSFGFQKVSETLLVEAKVMEGAREDDVQRLRSEVAEAIARSKKAATAPADRNTLAAGPSSAKAEAPAVSGPSPSVSQPAAESGVAYPVKRAQDAVNYRLRKGSVGTWKAKVVPDGRFGPKTEAALNAWARSIGAPSVQGSPQAATVQVSAELANALTKAYEEGMTVIAPPLVISNDDVPWMNVAIAETGQSERAGAAHNPRIIEYHAATTLKAETDEIAWCSSFVNWCLQQVHVKGTRSAAAASWVEWGIESVPRRGAIAVLFNPAAKNTSLSRSGFHVGFLLENEDHGYKLLGGNQGNKVKEAIFSKKKWALKALRWPAQT